MATKKKVEKPARNPAFKTDLDIRIIKGLKLSSMPVKYVNEGSLVFGRNPPPGGKAVPAYIIWDSIRSALPGFGIRVAGKKTCVIRR